MRTYRQIAGTKTTALLLALALAAPMAVQGDDRELVKGGSRDPYLHIIFDVSGSMNWQPPDPDAEPPVPGDAWAPGYGDDPNSKFYQAKSALYTVLSDPSLRGVLWGFSTYNQNFLRVHRKHYLYTPKTDPPWVTDGRLPYLQVGTPKHFGDHCMDDEDTNTSCDLDDGIFNPVAGSVLGSCTNPQDFTANTPQEFVDEEEGEVISFPVLGDTGGDETTEWVRFNNRKYRVRWLSMSGNLGDEEITVNLELRERLNDCSAWAAANEPLTLTFERVYKQDKVGRDLQGGNDVLFWQADYENWPNCSDNPSDPGPNERFDAGGFPAGFFHGGGCTTQIRDMRASGTCNGWEPNDDSNDDDSKGVLLKYTTQHDPLDRHPDILDRGDVIPLDWKGKQAWGVSNREAILQRLTPNYDPDDPAFAPDFRAAPYFLDSPDTLINGRLALKPEYLNRDLDVEWGHFEDTPPLIPQGSTPIGNSMKDFRDWFDTWKPEACDEDSGDPFFGCRSVNLLILTDGDETCYNHPDGPAGPLQDGSSRGNDYNPCSLASQLHDLADRNIRTFVIGFGVQGADANYLNCIAENGGTDFIDLDDPPDGEPEIEGPILPGNEQELVEALRKVVSVITVGTRSFSSAAVPQGQVNVEDRVYLTSFLPDRDLPIWPARVDAYLKPVPLVPVTIELPNGDTVDRKVPNPSRECENLDPDVVDLEGTCHLWNAAEELLLQAAEDNELMPGDYNLGDEELQRRVYFGRDLYPGLPMDRQYFAPPVEPSTEDEDWQVLLEAMGICAVGDLACGSNGTKQALGTEVLEFTHRKKAGNVPPDDPRVEPEPGDYILGDIFHSDPGVVGGPDNFRYWVADVGGNGRLPLDDYCNSEENGGSPDGYRCYFAKHRNRRKLLLTGANDGQLHAFDAGIFRAQCRVSPTTAEEFVVGRFDRGSGREIFSYVPQAVMPTLRELADSFRQEFTVDGRIASGDVFIDPLHDGIPTDPEWRTVVMGGLREGGSGYYVLDITHPDLLTVCDNIATIPDPLGLDEGFVPSCLDTCFAPEGGSDYQYPLPLFEFYDDEDCGAYLPDGRCDDDLDGRPDLANSWSTPTIGRIRVQEEDTDPPVYLDKYVAVFGGGMDEERKEQVNVGGDYLYMVDLETGKAIYKRRLPDPFPNDGRPPGSAASDPAAVDTDQNGYLDTIYIGTTRGYMYKADISQPLELVDQGSLGFKVVDPAGCVPGCWAPFPVFDTGDRPIYFPPAVVFVALRGQYALGFGTGDREDLWSPNDAEGRLYMILDNDFRLADYNSGSLPKVESQYPTATGVGIGVGEGATTADLLREAPFGWFIKLDERERVITRTFSLGGVTVFSSFQPSEEVLEDGTICLRRGSSRVFVVNTTNANPLLESMTQRYFMVDGGFLSAPFVESGTTTNPEEPCTGVGCTDTDATLPDNLDAIIEELRALLPPQCRFANYTINIKAVRDDTGIQFLAAIPVCTVKTNWRDF